MCCTDPPSTTNITITINGMIDITTAYPGSTLSCNSVAPFPTGYQWNGPNVTNATGPTITLLGLGSSLTYICTATNTQGSGFNSITLNITEPPMTTFPPGKYYLTILVCLRKCFKIEELCGQQLFKWAITLPICRTLHNDQI